MASHAIPVQPRWQSGFASLDYCGGLLTPAVVNSATLPTDLTFSMERPKFRSHEEGRGGRSPIMHRGAPATAPRTFAVLACSRADVQHG